MTTTDHSRPRPSRPPRRTGCSPGADRRARRSTWPPTRCTPLAVGTTPTAGVLHVLGAIAYGFVVLRVASWLPARVEARRVDPAHRAHRPGRQRRLRLRRDPHVAGRHPARGPARRREPDQAPGAVLPAVLRADRLGAGPAGAPLAGCARARRRSSPGRWPTSPTSPPLAVPVNIALVIAFGSLVWARSAADS